MKKCTKLHGYFIRLKMSVMQLSTLSDSSSDTCKYQCRYFRHFSHLIKVLRRRRCTRCRTRKKRIQPCCCQQNTNKHFDMLGWQVHVDWRCLTTNNSVSISGMSLNRKTYHQSAAWKGRLVANCSSNSSWTIFRFLFSFIFRFCYSNLIVSYWFASGKSLCKLIIFRCWILVHFYSIRMYFSPMIVCWTQK